MSSGKKSKKKMSKRTTIVKKVNKKGYTNKHGTRVGPYNRKVSSFPNPYITYRRINDDYRLCKITRKNGQEHVQVLEDRRKAKPITFLEAKRHFEKLPEKRQEADKRYKAKNTFTQQNVTSSYLTKTGTSRYDVDEIDIPPGESIAEKIIKEREKQKKPLIERQREIEERLKQLDKNERRLDIILLYPRGSQQEDLVKEYKELQKEITRINSREFELELQKSWIETSQTQKKDKKKTKVKVNTKRDNIQNFLKSKGWEQDKEGNYKKGLMRVSFTEDTINFERGYRDSVGNVNWSIVGSGSYDDYEIDREKDKIIRTPEKRKKDKQKEVEKGKKLKLKAKELPKLKAGEKYYIVSISPDGSVSYHGYSMDPVKVMKDYEIEKRLFERHKIKSELEIFPAKDIDEIRDRVHERKKAKFKDYKVSGDTYPNRHTLRGYGLEWDAREKAYRGKLSPEAIKTLEKLSGLNITEDKAYTEKEKKLSDIARKENRERRLKEQELKYKEWKDRYKPFSSKQVSYYNDYTHYPSDINKEYDEKIRTKEAEIKYTFNINNIEKAPLSVRVALYRYKKELYDKYMEDARARATAPPVSVVGPSKYKGKPERADRIRRKASEQLHNAEKKLDKEITNEYNKREKAQKAEIEFGPRGKVINSRISQIRKTHHIDISQSNKGSRNDKEWRTYVIRAKEDKIYEMNISETGSFSIHHYGPEGMILSKQIHSFDEIETELNQFFKSH